MNPSQAYITGPTPQALGAAMMPMDVKNADAPALASPSAGGTAGINPMALQSLMNGQQYTPGYTDSAGISGQTLASYGVAPGTSGADSGYGQGGLMGLLGMGGSQTAPQFSPEDMQKMQAMFAGGF